MRTDRPMSVTHQLFISFPTSRRSLWLHSTCASCSRACPCKALTHLPDVHVRAARLPDLSCVLLHVRAAARACCCTCVCCCTRVCCCTCVCCICCHSSSPAAAAANCVAGTMATHVDRPTAVANTLAAAVTDTFEDRPGADVLRFENTTRNRIKREVKNDKLRNLWLQRLYDGSFFIAWHMFEAVKRKLPTFSCPIRPYIGGELNAAAISHLVVELSCALCTVCNAIFDALCALCEMPPDLSMPQQPQPPPTEPTDQPRHAPIGTPIA